MTAETGLARDSTGDESTNFFKLPDDNAAHSRPWGRVNGDATFADADPLDRRLWCRHFEGELLANIITFPRAIPIAVHAEGTDTESEPSVEVQLAQLQRTLESWRLIVRQLDQLAEIDNAASWSEQSVHIRQLIADAERAIAEFQARGHGLTSSDDLGPG
ncbi:hypothetical protein ACQR16_35720 [Bradyrhizobium oligotrophicum]